MLGGKDKLDYKLSTCCNPIPGDSVFGFVTINEGIKVHKKIVQMLLPCSLTIAYHASKWIDSSQQEFKAIINITGMDTFVLQMSSQK
jgi:GTP pyrophosphokinase